MRPPRRADPASCFKGDLASSRSTHDCSLPRKPHRSSKTSVAPHHEGHVLKGTWGKPGELCFCPSCSSHFFFLRPHSLTDSSPSPPSRDMTSKTSVTFLRKTFYSPSHTFLACLLLHCRGECRAESSKDEGREKKKKKKKKKKKTPPTLQSPVSARWRGVAWSGNPQNTLHTFS